MEYAALTSELKNCVAPLTATPALSAPPHRTHAAPKRMPCATIRTTPSIMTATTRIQNPAGRVAVETRAGPSAEGLGGGGGNEDRGAPGAAPRSAPHRAQ